MRARLAVLLLTALVGGGCAFTDATLQVHYTEALATRGPLATVPSTRVAIDAIEDQRPEIDKIGYKRNGFNQKTAKIQTDKPVPEIVREALTIELAKNGHIVGGAEDNLALSGRVEEFWLDISMGIFTIDYVATTRLALTLVDRKSGQTLHSRTYRGYHKETAMGGLEGTWEQVTRNALQQMMREIGTDQRLAQALRRQSP